MEFMVAQLNVRFGTSVALLDTAFHPSLQ